MLERPKSHIPDNSSQRAMRLAERFSQSTTSFSVLELRSGSGSHPGYIFMQVAHWAEEARRSFSACWYWWGVDSFCNNQRRILGTCPVGHPGFLLVSGSPTFWLGDTENKPRHRTWTKCSLPPSGSLPACGLPAAFSIVPALWSSARPSQACCISRLSQKCLSCLLLTLACTS